MSTGTEEDGRERRNDGRFLLLPALAPFYDRFKPLTYALLRVAFGLTIATHGVPKLTNPLEGSTNMIGNVLNLPFAPQLAMLVALLETFGGLAIAIGLGTRIFAPALAIQMLFICFALWPVYPWIDRGIEYPLMLGFIGLLVSIHGGGAYSTDARIGREL